MSTANVFVKVGTTMARVKPENAEAVRAALVKASKVPTVKQARARALMGGCGREYPRFVEGTSVKQYVTDYYALNTEAFRGWTSASLRRGMPASWSTTSSNPCQPFPCSRPTTASSRKPFNPTNQPREP